MSDLLGLGTDILEVERFRKVLTEHGEKFLQRLFTEKERGYCMQQKDSTLRFAGRFAAKEAISKAFGTGFGEQLSWQDIEILPNHLGRPSVTFSEKAKEIFGYSPTILLSISHCHEYATATAILVRPSDASN